MTPRNVLQFRVDDAGAEELANDAGFDAVPISRLDGRVLDFWDRAERRRVRIRRVHRAAHDASIESLLKPLGAHLVQFVYYRSEVVGLIDASDLNRPVARIAWLQPMLELERAILDAIRIHRISESEQGSALGRSAAGVRRRQANAKGQNLDMQLLEYAYFKDLLVAANYLGLLHLDESDIKHLNRIRSRAAHSGDFVVQSRDQCAQLRDALRMARISARQVRGIRHRVPQQ